VTKETRNAFVQRRYDELMQEGKHGHYETMFRVVREAIAFDNARDLVVPCCGYFARRSDYPVMWNEYNEVVQCHNCGAVWMPK
jgi:hypothetical protein